MKTAYWKWIAIAMMALWVMPDASAWAQRERGGDRGGGDRGGSRSSEFRGQSGREGGDRSHSFAPRDSGQEQRGDGRRGDSFQRPQDRSRQFSDQGQNRGSRESFDRQRSMQSRDSSREGRDFSRAGRPDTAQRNFIHRNFQDRGSLQNMQRINDSQRAAARDQDRRDFARDDDRRDSDRRDFHRGDFIGDRIAGYRSWGRYGYPWWAWIPGVTWGWGYGPGFGYRSPYYGYGWGLPYYGYGYGGYGGWGYAYPTGGNYVTYEAQTPTARTADTAAIDRADAERFIAAGEEAFRAGQYQQALRHWQHAMVEDANNGALVLLMAQALFQVGEYQNAAGAVQMAMQMLPEAEWGNVVKNYTQIYGIPQHYNDRIKQLETARTEKADDPALRFLLGYHFGYLGYPKQAVRELDKALDLQPRDLGSQKLRDMFASAAGLPARAPAAQPAATPGDNPATTPALPGLNDAPPAAPQPPNKSVVPTPVQPE